MITYIYHALINALSAHLIHINLNMIVYTHAEHSPNKTIYIKYYTKTNKNALQTHTHTRTHYPLLPGIGQNTALHASEPRRCVKVEVNVLGSRPY